MNMHSASADLRSARILGSIRQTFAEKGFDGASMQDLARAAGMSVGNFYRYFPSKAAIVEALVTHDLEMMEQDFAAILQAPRPMQSLREGLAARLCEDGCKDDGPIWAEITAAALRKPEILTLVCRMEAAVGDNLVAVFARETGLNIETTRQRHGAHAAMIVMLIKAASMQHPDACNPRADLMALTLRIIDRILDDITGAPLAALEESL
ncbi:TetR/AcrR family transcriptional regulator [Rhodobacter ferrooxidans]|uniref:Transcriptional regulator, TetR family n=1 Tax=Rhodobacter ferrooxidans TaxID=371731 RepID=C8RX15_9RHOB|nr:TetR/AcrR family transcriptional regulator [Rhodobacter sp. SW2]EEW26540.1 transcriptional regulator, TetR family [Rhodobacter sp. SW2]